MDKYRIQLKFTTPLLGTTPLNQDVFEEIITPDLTQEVVDEELETLPPDQPKGLTGFHRVDGKPCVLDYMAKGYYKDSCSMLRRVDGTESAKIKAYKRVIDGLVFVKPRYIPIELTGDVTILTRPLRASTPRGERVSIARSECIPEGSSLEFETHVMGGVSLDLLTEWLDYGQYRGLGSWRNSGHGTFIYELEAIP